MEYGPNMIIFCKKIILYITIRAQTINFFLFDKRKKKKKLKLKLCVTNLTWLSHFMVLWIYPLPHLVQPLYWNMSSEKTTYVFYFNKKASDENFAFYSNRNIKVYYGTIYFPYLLRHFIKQFSHVLFIEIIYK